jgi:8-oxo-dGTP diphosphatase
MRKASRAIIIKDNQLLVMHRNKFGTEYDTLPGGNVEVDETIEQALFREVQEETMINFTNPRLVFIEHPKVLYGDQYIFLCDYVSGEPQLHPEAEEMAINEMGKNLYDPAWLPLDKLYDAPFLSSELQGQLLNAIDVGWPDDVLEFTSNSNINHVQ